MSSNPADKSPILTPKHVRAARALLAWSQQDLAQQAGMATSTVADFERGHRTPMANNAQAMRVALENGGIRFLPTGAVIGPPLPRIGTPERPGMPIRWVDATDLAMWADRLDGAASFPTLVAHLIRATHDTTVQLRFPSDEGIRHTGWDGWTFTEQSSLYVPQGHTGWEIGAQRLNIASKATDDYKKRTTKPAPLDPATSTYVFVTPRHWPRKAEWIQERREEGAWLDVRAYDADDLVHWIELNPTVGLWIATRLGKRPLGTRQLEEVWQEWSLATQWPLTEELVLSDRDENAAQVLSWLRAKPSVLSIQATTAEEAAAFFYATLQMLPDDVAAHYLARCLVATDAIAARALSNAPAPLIIILSEPDAGIASNLAAHGHFVLQTYDDGPTTHGEVLRLARPSREGIAQTLTDAGIPEARSGTLARDSGRNLAILRRLIPSAPGRLPAWAQTPPPRALLAALLIGGWDDESEGDKAKLAELAGQSFDEAVAILAAYVGEFDSPIRKIGSTWRITSPHDAWMLLAHYLTPADIARFEALAIAVLGLADPRYDMDPDKRWMAPLHGVRFEYSGLLRHGIGEVLILLALWGGKVTTMPDASQRAGAIVRSLLQGADQRRWWSLSRLFSLLSEASPNSFLEALEDSLDQSDPPVRALFSTEEGGVSGTEHLSDLLWALEALAWSPELLPRVSLALARLDAIDPGGRYMNRPANSLRQIYLLWAPQTHATLDQRLRALDLIRREASAAAWKLMLGILPRGHDTFSPSLGARWRDFTVDNVETVTFPLIARGAAALSDRLREDVGLSVPRWIILLDHLTGISPDRSAVIELLSEVEPRISSSASRTELWKALRKFLHHHRQFPDVEWSLPSGELDRLESIYNRLTPDNEIERIAWLFEMPVALPNPPTGGWAAEERQVDDARRQAAKALHGTLGVNGILALARAVSAGGYIGKALVDGGLEEVNLNALLEASLRSDTIRERDVGHGIIFALFSEGKEHWAANLISKAEASCWGNDALLTILRALPQQRWTWDQVSTLGPTLEMSYWRRAQVFLFSEDVADIAFAIKKLIGVGRARDALHLAGRDRDKQLPSDVLIEVLTQAIRQPFEKTENTNEAVMFQHNVVEILTRLDEMPDVSDDTLATLEWNYLSLLEYSRRPAKALLKALAQQPSLLVDMLRAIYKPSEESGVFEMEPDDPESAKAIASQAYRLLDMWNRIPGTRDDSSVDGEALETWIKEARILAKAAGREEIADLKIGNVLSSSSLGSDGIWPTETVRAVIDLFRSKSMIEGFWIGKRNRRGVTTRMPRDGGQLEREEAIKYRRFASAIAYDHPHTARALETLAESYEEEARRHDEHVERLDWQF